MLLMPVTVVVAPAVVERPRQAHSLSVRYSVPGVDVDAVNDSRYVVSPTAGAVKGRPPAAEPV
jgi:hypothetical protein